MTEWWSTFRQELPQLKDQIYFNHGVSAPMPASVANACQRGVAFESGYPFGTSTRELWQRVRDDTRSAAAQLIGAAPGNLAFVASTSAALSMVSLAVPWRSGDNVITSGIDNPAAIVPWQNLAHLGVEVRYLPHDENDLLDLEVLQRLLDGRTRLISLSLVQYATGQRLDLRRVADLCAPRGILLCVDAVQAVGVLPVDVAAMGANFLAFGGHKWLMGPRHVAVLYADDVALDIIRSPIVTESNVLDVQAEEELPTTGVPQLHIREGALKLEAVPYHNFPGIFGLQQALHNIALATKDAIYERVHALTSDLAEGLKGKGGCVISPRGDTEWSGIVSVNMAGSDPHALVKRLRAEGVHVAVRKGRLRICPHYYNTTAEIDEFLRILQNARQS